MAMVLPVPEVPEIGGCSRSSPLINSGTAKDKGPATVTEKEKGHGMKRVKSSTGNKEKPPVVTSSQKKRPAARNQQKHPPAKRAKFRSTGTNLNSPPLTFSPMMRLYNSPVVMIAKSPAFQQQNSPSPSFFAEEMFSSLHSMSERSTSPVAHSSPMLTPLSPIEQPSIDEQPVLPTSHVGSTSTPPRVGKRRKLRSKVWKEIEPVYRNGRLVQGKCTHCYEVFPSARNSGTSHMHRHLLVCEARAKILNLVAQLESSSKPVSNWKYDPYRTRQELVGMITLHELSFSLVEYEGFRRNSASLNPLFEPVSRTTIKENCMDAYKNQRSKLRDIFGNLKSRISLTADLWTSKQNVGYMSVTAHYIDDEWKVQKRIVRFCSVKTPHDSTNIYNVMLKSIKHYNMEDKLFSITLDNASVNKTVVDMLRATLLAKNMLHCNGTLFHARCAAHVLNLIVKDGLHVLDGLINNIRESVKYIKGSTSRKEKLEEIIADLRISCNSRPSLDVSTRWNSTFDMIESAEPFKEAFHELRQQDPNYKYAPSLEDWERADMVCDLLRVFKKATEVISGSTYPTSNLYFHQLWDVREKLEEQASSTNSTIKAMVKAMKAKLDKYWEISYLTVCIPVILDPRFKFGFVDFHLRKIFKDSAYENITTVEETFRNLFSGYSSQVRDTSSNDSSMAQGNDTTLVVKGQSWSDWSHHVSSQRKQTNSELDRYLRDDLFPCDTDEFDILHWWKTHALKYPILSRMAQDVLAVPASTVASESAFSTGGRVISDYRTRLSINTVEALICFQDWLRAAGSSYLDIIQIDNFVQQP